MIPELILKRLNKESTPFIDGSRVTFVWKGRTAPLLIGDITGWEDGKPIPLTKQGKGLWAYQQNFPPDAYIEYGFVTDGASVADPFNPRQTSNGVGGFNNFFSMPGYHPVDLARVDPDLPHGHLRRFSLPSDYLITSDKRTVHLYQPPVSGQVPLLIVWDGQDYLKRVHLDYIVDRLIAMKRIQPIALAFVNNGGQRSRNIEYSCNEATLVWLMHEVLPLAKRELNLLDIGAHPGEFGVLGASMGGLMALYTGARFPHIFGHVLCQSGAFSMAGYDLVVFDLLEHGTPGLLKIWLDVGQYDLKGLLEVNRRMKSMLTHNGYTVTYREYNAGHNYPSWKDEIWRGLEALYGLNK